MDPVAFLRDGEVGLKVVWGGVVEVWWCWSLGGEVGRDGDGARFWR